MGIVTIAEATAANTIPLSREGLGAEVFQTIKTNRGARKKSGSADGRCRVGHHLRG